MVRAALRSALLIHRGASSALIAARSTTVVGMGSKGSKPRKPHEHLPKVGSPANREWEHRTEQREVFGSWPVWIVLGALVVLLAGWLLVTLETRALCVMTGLGTHWPPNVAGCRWSKSIRRLR